MVPLPPSPPLFEINTINVATRSQTLKDKGKENVSIPWTYPFVKPSQPPKPKISILGTSHPTSSKTIRDSMVKQLHQTPVKMSLYDLIQSSPHHCQALIIALQVAKVQPEDPQPLAALV